MAVALREAACAYDEGEVPVGAVIVSADGRILGKAHNQREQLQDPTAHAEILALTQAAAALGSWRLTGTTLFATLEPCPMCAGALVNARVGYVFDGPGKATSEVYGFVENLTDEEYELKAGYPMPGVNGRLGLVFRF